MIIKTRLTEKDYISVNFHLLYRRWFIKFMTALGMLYILLFLADLIFGWSVMRNDSSSFIYPAIALFLFPLTTYLSAKRNYKTSGRIQEVIEYNFTPDYLDVKGESFTSQLGWEKFYKVTKSKNWLLIWQNRQVANIIPRRDVWDSQIEELKEILITKSVKNNL